MTHYYAGIYEIPSNEANSTKGEQVILVPPPPPPPTPSQQGAIKYEILRSIVYGGLIESITSLGVVTSAASANATTCKCLEFLFCFLFYYTGEKAQYTFEIIATTF